MKPGYTSEFGTSKNIITVRMTKTSIAQVYGFVGVSTNSLTMKLVIVMLTLQM